MCLVDGNVNIIFQQKTTSNDYDWTLCVCVCVCEAMSSEGLGTTGSF